MNLASYNGQTVEVTSRNGGWSTILLDNGSTRKVRNGALSKVAAATEDTTVAKTASKKAASKAASKKTPAAKGPKAPRVRKAASTDDTRLIKADLSRYEVADVKTASGRKAIDIGDKVAKTLRGADISDAYRAAADATGETQKALRERYQHLNPGMQRMNLGNLIRGAASKAAREKANA